MSELIDIKPGDFVVDMGRYSIVVRKVVRVTDKCYFYQDEDGYRSGRDIRTDRHQVVFSGPKDIAERLRDQLTSSRDLRRQDEKAAYDRWQKRDADYIAAVRG